MLLKCCLLHRDIVLPRYDIFSIFVSMSTSIYALFITINQLRLQIISLIQTNLVFGHICQKFRLRVLLSFCLIFCQFQPGIAYKVLLMKKSVYYQNHLIMFVKESNFQTSSNELFFRYISRIFASVVKQLRYATAFP